MYLPANEAPENILSWVDDFKQVLGCWPVNWPAGTAPDPDLNFIPKLPIGILQ